MDNNEHVIATLPFFNGTLIIKGTHHIVTDVYYVDKSIDECIGFGEVAKAKIQLEEYRDLKRKKFNFKIDIKGTKFQQAVYHHLFDIPFSTVISYQELAKLAGYPKAARAVGQAMSVNKLMIVVPCHRVIASNNKIGGFTGGLELKQMLFNLEMISGIRKNHEKKE